MPFQLLLSLVLLAPQAEERNVLFYLIDTCRADMLSLYGHERPTTPFLEELASRGVTFERCYSQAPWTKPSLASILTSLPPSATGIVGMFERLDGSYTLLPEVLRESGYYTAGFSANPLMGRLSNYNQRRKGDRYLSLAHGVRDKHPVCQRKVPVPFSSTHCASGGRRHGRQQLLLPHVPPPETSSQPNSAPMMIISTGLAVIPQVDPEQVESQDTRYPAPAPRRGAIHRLCFIIC